MPSIWQLDLHQLFKGVAARANMQVGDCRGAPDHTLGCVLSWLLDESFSKVSRTSCVLMLSTQQIEKWTHFPLCPYVL